MVNTETEPAILTFLSAFTQKVKALAKGAKDVVYKGLKCWPGGEYDAEPK